MSLKNKIESAFKTVLTATPLATGVAVFLGVIDEEQIRPCVVINCDGGKEDPLGSGNRWMDVAVTVKSQVEDDAGLVAHHALITSVDSRLKIDELAVDLSATTLLFHVFDPAQDMGQTSSVIGRAAVHEQRFMIYCCEQDLI
jgi:hypothetical protein